MFCKETVQMDYLLVWSFLLQQPAQIQVMLDLPENTHPYAHSPMCSNASRLKYNKQLLINMSKLSQYKSQSNSIFPKFVPVENTENVMVFLPNIPHVLCSARDMFVAFLFVA